MKLTNSLKRIIVEAFAESMVKSLINKYSQQTNDSPETIKSYIDDFQKYQNNLPVDKRDITKLSYDDLKNIIEPRKVKKSLEDDFLEIKRLNQNVNDSSLRQALKKFYEIKSELPKGRQDAKRYEYLNLLRFIEENYEKLLYKKYIPIFKKEEPQTSDETIQSYLRNYIDFYEQIPFRSTPLNFLSFIELEHLVDGISAKKDVGPEKREDDYSDVQMIYNQGGEVILRPTTKKDCIKYARGRGWCITWPGAQNRYYYYRLDKKRTIYFTIDEDKPYGDVNHILVILVGQDGTKYVADGSNNFSKQVSGEHPHPWSFIVSKQPKLEGLEDLFVPIELNEKEKEIISQLRGKKVGNDLTKEFPNLEMLEIWVELLDYKLNDEQYISLPNDLKKKYIASGFDLSPGQIEESDVSTINYYIKKKLDALKRKGLSELTDSDIKLLNTPSLSSLKKELKSKYITQVGVTDKSNKLEITYPNSQLSKFISLYGFDEKILEDLPDSLIHFGFVNTSSDKLNIVLPEDMGRLSNLTSLYLQNCVSKIPESFGNLKNLTYLSLPNNPMLTKLPDSMFELPMLKILRLEGSPVQIPEKYRDVFVETKPNSGFWRKIK